MPVIKSAKKRMRQNEVRRERNVGLKSRMKTEIKNVLATVKAGSKEEAEKALRVAYSVIDTALKKNQLHRNNAARKKSRLARMLAGIGK